MRIESSSKRTVLSSIMGVGIVMGSLGWMAGHARAGGIAATAPMHYAGSIAEQGVPVNGTRAITIIVWNDATAMGAANELCVTTTAGTSVQQGRFEVPLSDSCTAPIQSTPDAWVEVQIGGDSFGRQKIGASPYAVIAGAVNGQVRSDVVSPNFAAYGTLDAGSGGASIYNDGTSKKALVITGNTVADVAGIQHTVLLQDDVTVGNNETVSGTLTVNSAINLGSTAKVGLGVYVNTASATTTVSCNAGDVALSGGGDCHISPDDQLMFASHPIIGAANQPTGWFANCANHSNSNAQEAPLTMYVVCMHHGA